jgi:hypothetical protein
MSFSPKLVVRLMMILLILTGGLILLGQYMGSAQASCVNGACPHCDKVQCVSACWADGTVPTSNCTTVRQTQIAPNECPPFPGGPGCRTVACP